LPDRRQHIAFRAHRAIWENEHTGQSL